MATYSMMTPKYTYLWKKYRPAVLRLMIDSAKGPQEYRFSNHEFRDVNPKQKGGYSFTLRVFESKAVNNIRTSEVAKDLLAILQLSGKASELTQSSIYEFVLDKQFVLHITQEEIPPEMKEENQSPEEEASAKEEGQAPEVETAVKEEAKAPEEETASKEEAKAPEEETASKEEDQAPEVEAANKEEDQAPEKETSGKEEKSPG